MTDAAHDLYLVVAVLALLPAVTLGGMPVLAQSAFVAVGGVGALQLERAGLPIGGAVLAAIALGGVAGALTGVLVEPCRAAVRRALDVGARLARVRRAARLPVAVRRRAGPDAAARTIASRRRSASRSRSRRACT